MLCLITFTAPRHGLKAVCVCACACVRACTCACANVNVSRVSLHVFLLTEITSHHGKHTPLHQESDSQSKVSTQITQVRANSDKCGLSRPAVTLKVIIIKHHLYSTFQDAVKNFSNMQEKTEAEGKNIRMKATKKIK